MNVKPVLKIALLTLAFQAAFAEQLHQAEIDKAAYSVTGMYKTKIIFLNRSGETRKIYWLDYKGIRNFYEELLTGKDKSFETFLSHPWLVTDESDNALEIYYPDTKERIINLE